MRGDNGSAIGLLTRSQAAELVGTVSTLLLLPRGPLGELSGFRRPRSWKAGCHGTHMVLKGGISRA
uniref:Uncharacterized protein n=2 Tax=unclassified Streptomyces TaxID=2593676 RepID=V9Z1K1_9ACTN|nr:hypothetical protein pFRL3_164 [Streptomyces sp. FR1]AHE39425.1 hypothetical protein pFRL4_192 [Streptomyces sp. F2]